MPHTILADRSLIKFSGPDAEHLLHNVVTCNVETLETGIAQISALLTPQGKIMFDFLINKVDSENYLVDIAREQASAFKQRMTMYKLRSKVEISESPETFVRVSWDDDSSAHTNKIRDTRFAALNVTREHMETGSATDRTVWDRLRINHGVPESGTDYTLGDAFPHDVSLDQNGGVDFKKGCYIGQEVVSRMHHRHTARRRILIADSHDDFGEDKAIESGGKPVGQLGTCVERQALALCRIDRVKDAIDAGAPILAGDTALTMKVPPHVSYDWPSGAENG